MAAFPQISEVRGVLRNEFPLKMISDVLGFFAVFVPSLVRVVYCSSRALQMLTWLALVQLQAILINNL